MKKFFICALMVACLCVGSASAADAQWSTADQANLAGIHRSLTSTVAGTLLSAVNSVNASVGNVNSAIGNLRSDLGFYGNGTTLYQVLGFSYGNSLRSFLNTEFLSLDGNLEDIKSQIGATAETGSLAEILTSTGDGSLHSVLNKILTQSTTTATYQKYLANTTTIGLWAMNDSGSPVKTREISSNILGWVGQLYSSLMWDGINPHTYDRTLYSRIKQLQEVLASDDDLALAESQKNNREYIEAIFLDGDPDGDSSSSLGVTDFIDIATTGEFVTSLIVDSGSNVGSFVSNYSFVQGDALGWFTPGCARALDAVSVSSVTYSNRSVSDDPYNMRGFTERYVLTNGGDHFDH